MESEAMSATPRALPKRFFIEGHVGPAADHVRYFVATSVPVNRALSH
jgi:hypothetical protein